jgi:hypothetical protein
MTPCILKAIVQGLAPAAHACKNIAAYLALMRSVLQIRTPDSRTSAIQFFLGICYGGFWATITGCSLCCIAWADAGRAARHTGSPGRRFCTAGRWMTAAGLSGGHHGHPPRGRRVHQMQAAWAARIIVGAVLLDLACAAMGESDPDHDLPEARSRVNTVFGVRGPATLPSS